MQNPMVVFTFSALNWKDLFWGKFGPKNRNCVFNLKFEFSMDVHFFVFDGKYPFWAELGLKHANCQFKLKFGT